MEIKIVDSISSENIWKEAGERLTNHFGFIKLLGEEIGVDTENVEWECFRVLPNIKAQMEIVEFYKEKGVDFSERVEKPLIIFDLRQHGTYFVFEQYGYYVWRFEASTLVNLTIDWDDDWGMDPNCLFVEKTPLNGCNPIIYNPF